MSLTQGRLVTFGTAVMFLTRLPVGRYASGDMQVLAESARYFPLVGLLVAAIMGGVLSFFAVFLPLSVAVGCTLVAGVLCTGALHEDGLADVADGAGAFSIDRKLEIMRDSRVGTYGSLALILCIILRFVLLWELAQLSVFKAIGALVLAHAAGRWGCVYLMATIPYARPEAANKVVARGVDTRVLFQSSVCLLFVLLVPAVFLSPWVYAVTPALLLATLCCGAYFKSTFEGITGDCLGAANVVVEVFCLMLVLAALRFI